MHVFVKGSSILFRNHYQRNEKMFCSVGMIPGLLEIKPFVTTVARCFASNANAKSIFQSSRYVEFAAGRGNALDIVMGSSRWVGNELVRCSKDRLRSFLVGGVDLFTQSDNV